VRRAEDWLIGHEFYNHIVNIFVEKMRQIEHCLVLWALIDKLIFTITNVNM
jgi:hypothetical protein